MRSILTMFSKSPFRPLSSHIEKVRSCVDQVLPMFEALEAENYQTVEEISSLIIQLEYDADKIKDDIRNHLPQSIFLPVDKRDFMHLLSAQDDIADAVEDLAILLTIRNLKTPEQIREPLKDLVAQVVGTAHMACDLIRELDALLEASFSGAEAEKVEKSTQQLGTAEWEADKKQFQLAKKLFALDELKPAELLLWNEVIKKLGAVADKSEHIGKTLRVFLSK